MRRSTLAWISVFFASCLSVAACGDGEPDVLGTGGTGGTGTGGTDTGGTGTGGTGGNGVGGDGALCPTAQIECSGLCVSPASDRNNCGECGNTCGAGELCVNSECELSCPDSLLACGSSCVNPLTDPEYCGATSCDDGGMGGLGGTSGAGEECGPREACLSGACREAVLEWSEPARVDETEVQVGQEYDIASDSAGNAVAVWREFLVADDNSSLRLFASRFDAATEQWSTPQRIDNSDLPVRNPTVDMSADGQALAAWVEGAPLNPNTVSAAYFDGSTWQAATRLDVDPDADPSIGATSDFPEAAMDADGDGIVVWSQSSAIAAGDIPATFQIIRSEFIGGAFQAPVAWDYVNGASDLVRMGADHENVGINSAGQVFVIWEEGTSNANMFPVVSQGTLGGTWSQPLDVRVDTAVRSSSATVGIDEEGDAVAAWTGGDLDVNFGQQRFFRRVFEADAWQSESSYGFPNTDYDFKVARAGMTRTGDKAMVIMEKSHWESGDPSNDPPINDYQLMASNYVAADGAWTDPMGLAPVQTTRPEGAIDMDGLGNALVGFRQSGAPTVRQYLSASESWIPATQLAPAGGTPALASSPSGAAFAIWMQNSQLFVSRLK